MFLVRTFLSGFVCLVPLFAAGAGGHPLYFEQRSNDLFETRANRQIVSIRADCVDLGGVAFRFLHASRNASLKGEGKSAPSTYITRSGASTLRQYPKARIRGLYQGIDASFYGTPGHLEYDLELAPGAKPDRIRMAVTGARSVRIGEEGDLVVQTRSGELRQLAPRVFQSVRGAPREIAAHFVLLSDNEVGFRLAKHDTAAALTIDPVIVYTKYFGGSDTDFGGPVATDAQGNVYIAGSTNSIDFPSTNGTKARLQSPLLVYSNAGQNVSEIPVATQVSVTAIAGSPDGAVLYVATPQGLFYSGDHGATFTAAAAFPKPVTVNALSVDALDPSQGWAATTGGLFSFSSNGQGIGENDEGVAVAGNGMVNAASVEINPVNPLVVYATTMYPNYLYATTQDGVFWQQLFPSYPGEPSPGQFPISPIAFTLTSGGSELYAVDNFGYPYKSADGGMTWVKLSAHQLFGATSITIDPNNSSNVYVVDSAGLERSTDGGATYTTIASSSGGVNVSSFAMDASEALYIAINNGQLEVSADQGATWKVLARRPVIHALASIGGQVFVAVDSPYVPFLTKWSSDGSQLLYSTIFGGSAGDSIAGIAVDAQGEAIIAGNTASPDFPLTGTIPSATTTPAFGGPSQIISNGFVAKLSADGSQAIYSSVIVASKGSRVTGVAIDASDNPYIAGTTQSPDFPTTVGAFDAKLPTATCERLGGGLLPIVNLGSYGFVSKLNADASSLAYSTFLTGACGSVMQGIALDSANEAVVVGYTPSPDFPASPNAYQTTFPGGQAAGVSYPNPIDFGFVTKLSAAGDKLIASSLIGGVYVTAANAVTLDASGNAYIVGSTWGITPGATPDAYQTKVMTGCNEVSIGPSIGPLGGSDAFLLKLDPLLSTAQYLTYLGGICDDSANSILVQPSGNVWIAGIPSQNFPLATPYELPGTGPYFVSEFSADGSQLLFSSISDGQSLAQGSSGAIYIAGQGQPISGAPKNSSFDVSLTKINPTGTPDVTISSIGPSAGNQTVLNPAESIPSTIAPGELIAIAGQHLGPGATVMAQLDATGRLPFQVSGTSVLFNGYLAPLISVQDSLIVCFAPFEITGLTDVTVNADGELSTPVRVAVSPSNPYILSILNPDGSMNSQAHPAPQESVITIYVTGLGLTSPLSQDGSVSAPPLPLPVTPVTVYIGNNQAPPQFVAAADSLVAGITQVNVQIPAGASSGTPVQVSVNFAAAQIFVAQ